MEEEWPVVDKRRWMEQQGSCWYDAEESSMEEYGESGVGGGGGAKEEFGGAELAYKSVGRDPYLKGMKRKIETDLE